VGCLRNGLGKRLSGCAPYPGRPEPVVSGRPEAAGKKIGLQLSTQRRSGVYYQPLETQKGNSR